MSRRTFSGQSPLIFLAIVSLVFSHFADKLRLRWPFVLASLLLAGTGFAINIADVSNGVKYFGTFVCVAGTYSATPGFVAWSVLSTRRLHHRSTSSSRLGGNVAGQYKRAATVALHIGIGNSAGAAVSNIYRAQDAPGYKLGRKSCRISRSNASHPPTDAIELGLVGLGLTVLPILVIVYSRVNAQREAIMERAARSGGLQYTDEELRRMGDKAPNFRYGI